MYIFKDILNLLILLLPVLLYLKTGGIYITYQNTEFLFLRAELCIGSAFINKIWS